MPIRSLSLRRDVLVQLSPDELRETAAGAPTAQRITCPLTDCVLPSGQYHCWAPTSLGDCPTWVCD